MPSLKPTDKLSVSSSGMLPTPGTPGVGGKGNAGTVFQREAYCELCQREFCNKYFLKTHKANIHGIVDPSDMKSPSLMAKVNQPIKQQSTSPTHEPPPPQSQPRMPSLQSATQKPMTNESMEDFCEICQKHFCNKYYLKKHKVDVHNLRPDGSKSSHLPGENPMENRSMPHMPPLPSVSSSAMPSMPMMMPPLNSFSPSSMNNMVFVNPFASSMAAMSMVPPMMQHQFFMPGMSNFAAAQAQAASQAFSNVSPPQVRSVAKPAKPVASLERGEALTDTDAKAEGFCDICRLVDSPISR